MTESDVQDPVAMLRHRAMDLLARREHSARELQTKLTAKLPECAEYLPEVLNALKEENLQSDHRFAEAFISSRTRRGQGPCRIRLELQQRGVAEDLIGRALAECGEDWFRLAGDVLRRKYGDSPCDSFRERARRSRFLQYRGFSAEQIRCCFDDD